MFFLGHGVVSVSYQLVFSQFVKRRSVDYTSVCGDVYIVLCVCGHVKWDAGGVLQSVCEEHGRQCETAEWNDGTKCQKIRRVYVVLLALHIVTSDPVVINQL